MAKITGDFGSSQKANGVVELLSPLAMVWRRPLEWGGTSSLGSDGVSVTFTNTNLPKEGEIDVYKNLDIHKLIAEAAREPGVVAASVTEKIAFSELRRRV